MDKRLFPAVHIWRLCVYLYIVKEWCVLIQLLDYIPRMWHIPTSVLKPRSGKAERHKQAKRHKEKLIAIPIGLLSELSDSDSFKMAVLNVGALANKTFFYQWYYVWTQSGFYVPDQSMAWTWRCDCVKWNMSSRLHIFVFNQGGKERCWTSFYLVKTQVAKT